ncbi:hypothetical protein HPB52_017716 [Rhipicephalus sanguineus]|uniref:Uncharacterized protein n=1 Tax=Rhipicephalus sanguineus TaxID=34632 RepID=A0A9D4YQF2_RHISA|nr:hypothetical protein HPB52_017716 [Rhipicephalus sanguineus]
MDTARIKAPMPTEEEYLQDMLRVWRGKNSAVASRDAGALAAERDAASRSQHAQGKSAPSVASQRAKQLQWRPKNTPLIEKDDIIVVLKPREMLDIKVTFGPGQAGTAVCSILGADATTISGTSPALRLVLSGRRSCLPRQNVRNCERPKLSAEPNVVTVRKLGDTSVAVITFAGTKWAAEQILVRDRSLAVAQAAGSRYLLLLLTTQQNTNAARAASSVAVATRLELPVVSDGPGNQ